MQTPWGKAQHVTQLFPGACQVKTASHGGIRVSDRIRKRIEHLWPDFETFAGWPWLEEDCDAAAVVLAYPDHFDPAYVHAAVLSAPAAGLNPIPRAAQEINDRFLMENGDSWQPTSMSTGGAGWRVTMRRLRDGEKKIVEMPYPEQSLYTDMELEAFK